MRFPHRIGVIDVLPLSQVRDLIVDKRRKGICELLVGGSDMVGVRSVIIPILIVVTGALLTGCWRGFAPGLPADSRPAAGTVHIQSIEIPAHLKAGVPFDLALSLLVDEENDFGQHLAYRAHSSGFEQGVERGTYENVLFLGVYKRQTHYVEDTGVGFLSSEAHIPLVFDSAGRHVIYIAHARSPENSGASLALFQVGSYSAESDLIEYKKVVIDVQP